jgi:hypothetical protein
MTTIRIKVPNWLDFIFTCPLLTCRLLRYGYPFRKIPLGEGRFTIVEPRDFYWLNNFHWTITGDGEHIYAVRNIINARGKTMIIRLHREIMNAPKGLLVDHKNSDTLDNRRANLRLATHSQNQFNKRKTKTKASSQYVGVHFDKSRGQWGARIKHGNKSIWLGRFDSEIDAAKAYDEAAKKYHGEFARLNFTESADSVQRVA